MANYRHKNSCNLQPCVNRNVCVKLVNCSFKQSWPDVSVAASRPTASGTFYNILQLNQDRDEILVTGPKALRQKPTTDLNPPGLWAWANKTQTSVSSLTQCWILFSLWVTQRDWCTSLYPADWTTVTPKNILYHLQLMQDSAADSRVWGLRVSSWSGV